VRRIEAEDIQQGHPDYRKLVANLMRVRAPAAHQAIVAAEKGGTLSYVLIQTPVSKTPSRLTEVVRRDFSIEKREN
jgi:hypothetical protein